MGKLKNEFDKLNKDPFKFGYALGLCYAFLASLMIVGITVIDKSNLPEIEKLVLVLPFVLILLFFLICNKLITKKLKRLGFIKK